MRSKQALMINQLDQKIKPFLGAELVVVPEKGWMNTIRTSLKITLKQLGNKLNITKQGVKKNEENESKGVVTIKTLKDFADVLDLNFVYGFVPKAGSFDTLLEQKATELATKIVSRTNQTMTLEDQNVEYTMIDSMIKELAYELKREMTKSLWD